MRAAAVFALALVAGTGAAAPFPAAPFRIDHTFEPTGYRARIALDDPRFVGHIEIDGTLAKPATLLWLHGVGLTVQSAHAIGPHGNVPLEVPPPRGDQKIGLHAPRPLPAGHWTLVLDYTGTIYDHLPHDAYASDAPSYFPHSKSPPALALFHRTFGDKTFFYTQSEEIYARWIFPCIDEPDRKVPWQLTLDIPAGDLATSNAPIARTTLLDASHTRVEFAPTAPLPSYLVAFAVGPFDVVDAGRDTYGMPIRILAMPGHDAAVAHAAQLAPRLLDELEAYFAMRYPYPKLDLVEVPDAHWAMENPGVITFDLRYLETDYGPDVLAHELSHQWFGDLVTPRWWGDLWLNESFADWMGERLLRQLAGEMYDPIARRAHLVASLGGGTRLHHDYDDDRALRFDEMPFGE